MREEHSFELPVQAYVLVECMRRRGVEVEAGGGRFIFDFENVMTWRVKAVPEVVPEGDGVVLTWVCGATSGIDTVFSVADTPCIQWTVNPAFLGVRIDAQCTHPRFVETFYWLIDYAVKATPQAQEAEDRRVEKMEKDWWAAVESDDTELPSQEGETQKNKGGRKRLQAHRNALQRLVDGQTRQLNFAQWKTEYEKETGIDPEHTASGAWELHRSMVWRKYSPDETQKSTG